MSQDPLALPALTAGAPHETEYDAVHAAVTATERGRWFLTEYANRNRQTDTHSVVAAMARVEARIEAAIRGDAMPQAFSTAGQRLDDSAGTQAQIEAAVANDTALKPTIAAVAERILDISFGLRERAADAGLCDALDAAAREIADACKPPKANGHSSPGATELLRDLGGRVAAPMDHSPTAQSGTRYEPPITAAQNGTRSEPHWDEGRALDVETASAALLADNGDESVQPQSVAADLTDDKKSIDTVLTLAASLTEAASALDPRGELPDLTLPMPGDLAHSEALPIEAVAVAEPELPSVKVALQPSPPTNGGTRWHIEGPDFFFGPTELPPDKAPPPPVVGDDDNDYEDDDRGLLPTLQLGEEPESEIADFVKVASAGNGAASTGVERSPGVMPALTLSSSNGFESPTKIAPPLYVANNGSAHASTQLPSRDPFAALRGLNEDELRALFS
jgi:hypothetical protein